MIFSFSAVSGLLFLSLGSDSGEKADGEGEKKKRSRRRVAGREERRGVCQTHLRFFFCLAQHRAHKPERPSEPWLKGVHLTQAEWEEDAKPHKA
jgi:hypothetical protein